MILPNLIALRPLLAKNGLFTFSSFPMCLKSLQYLEIIAVSLFKFELGFVTVVSQSSQVLQRMEFQKL